MEPQYRIIWRFLFATSLVLSLLAVPGSTQEKKQKKAQTNKTEARPAGGESKEGEGDNPRRREEWFYRQRRFPLSHIPAGARQKALERKEEMRRAQREASANRAAVATGADSPAGSGSAAAAPLAPSTTTWTHVGPMPALSVDLGVGFLAGRVSAIAVDPTSANTVFVGGAQGGVWKSTDGGVNWATTFDGSKSLAIGAIAIDPSSPVIMRTIYVGTGEQNFSGDSYYGAGIYKSTDGGASWNQIPGETITNAQTGAPNSFLPPAAAFNEAVGGVHISSIVVHPANSMKIFAGVQIFENFDGGASSGLYCSDDAGLTWTQLLHGAIGTDVQIHPANIGTGIGSVGYAALGSPNGDTTTPSPNPSGDTAGQNGVYKSTNANAACTLQSWTLVSSAPVPVGVNAGQIRIGVAPSDATAMTVYAAVGSPSSADTLAGVFKTTNGGANWTAITPPTDFCAPQCSYDLVVKVHPNDKNTVFLGGSRATSGSLPFFLIASNDSGATWHAIAGDGVGSTLHVDQHALAFGFTGVNATKMYVGNDGGIWSAALPAAGTALTNSSIAWSNLNSGLEMLQFYPGISIHPATNQIAYAGTQDNGTLKMDASGGSPLQWNELDACGDGGYTAIDPSTPSTVYAACELIDVEKSLDSGATFNKIDTNGITGSDRSEFIAPLVIDPVTPQTLYFGTFRVWQTTDGGASWNAISPDLTRGTASGDDITSISISPPDSNVVYVGTFGNAAVGSTASGFVQRTTNASAGTGATWTPIDGGTLPPRAITQVAADPNHNELVFVTMSGFSGFKINPPATDTQGHVFRCSGVAPIGCTDISGSGAGALPNIPVNAIVVDPTDATSNTIYIGTDLGVFGTTNGGTSWIADYPGVPNGLPNVAVLGMAIHPASRILRVATHGRGAWDLQLGIPPPPTLSSISPTSGVQGQTLNNVTLTGMNLSGATINAIPGITITNVMATAAQVTATFTIAANAPTGARNVTVTTPSGTSGAVTFTVNMPPPPTLSTISPTSGVQGQTINNVTLTGMNLLGATINAPNAITISNVVVTATQVTATFTIAANAPLGPQNITVTTAGGTSAPVMFGISSDFTFGAANPASGTVSAPGMSTQTTIQLTPGAGGYPGPVSLSCTGLPFEAACVFSPPSPIAQNAGAVSVVVTITTRAASLLPPASNRRPGARPLGVLLWTVAALALIALLRLRAGASPRRYAYFAALLVILGGLAMSCGGGGSAPPVVGDPGTPVGGPTNITITASSGGVSHTSHFMLTVQ